MTRQQRLSQKGFTIIELMIATAVLSTILVTVSIIMINIGNLYYKGVNQARVQDDSRTIVDTVSQHLELNGLPPKTAAPDPNGTQAVCIGTTRYSYVIGVQVGTPPPNSPGGTPAFRHVLWQDTIQSPDTCLVARLTANNPSAGTDVGGASATNGNELIAPNSRLINFSISPPPSPYNLIVGVAYGGDDLLCSAAVPNSCSTATTMTAPNAFTNGSLLCKGAVKGDQFCAASSLNTTVVQRLTSN